jgi:hypothetical protein
MEARKRRATAVRAGVVDEWGGRVGHEDTPDSNASPAGLLRVDDTWGIRD